MVSLDATGPHSRARDAASDEPRRPGLELTYAAVIRAADRGRGLIVGELERRQVKIVRDERGPRSR